MSVFPKPLVDLELVKIQNIVLLASLFLLLCWWAFRRTIELTLDYNRKTKEINDRYDRIEMKLNRAKELIAMYRLMASKGVILEHLMIEAQMLTDEVNKGLDDAPVRCDSPHYSEH